MNIGDVKIENFLTVKEAEFSLSNIGLTLIQGENKTTLSADSNGAGKSSLADAVCWGIWGVTARGESGNAVIRHKTKLAKVSVEIVDDTGIIYLIERTRKKGSGVTSVTRFESDGTETSLTGGTEKLTQAVIQSIVGCSEDVFRAANYIGQDKLIMLPGMTDKYLKMIVEEAAGVNALNEAHMEARRLMSEAQTLEASNDASLSSARFTLSTLTDRLTETKGKMDTFEVNRKAKIASLQELFQGYMKNIHAVMLKNLEEITDDPKAYQERIDKGKEAISGAFAKFADQTAKNTAAVQQLNAAQSNLKTVRDELARYQATEIAKKHDIETVKDRIGTKCSHCGSTITFDNIESAKAHAEAAWHHVVDQIDVISDRVTKWEEIVQEKEKCVAKNPAPDLDDLNRKRALLDRREKEFLAALDGVRQAEEAKENRLKEIASVENEINPHRAIFDRDKSDYKLTAEKIAKMETEALAIQHDVDVAKKTVQVFGAAGVRAQILDQVTPFLNERTARYLSTLTDGDITALWTTLTTDSKGALKEKFSIEVTHIKNGAGFNGISGGERQRVALACAFALQDLVATRATKPVHLLIADEIDDAMDTAGLERLMSILQEKAKERGSVLVISHNDLKSWIGNVWTVTKTDNGSVVK